MMDGAPEYHPVALAARRCAYMGSPAIFRNAEFVDVTPPGRDRLVMRYTVGADQ